MKDMTSRELLDAIDSAAKAVAERFKDRNSVMNTTRQMPPTKSSDQDATRSERESIG
jgi:hypothetical protein